MKAEKDKGFKWHPCLAEKDEISTVLELVSREQMRWMAWGQWPVWEETQLLKERSRSEEEMGRGTDRYRGRNTHTRTHARS